MGRPGPSSPPLSCRQARAASSAGWHARPPPARRWGSICPIRARACWRSDGTARAGTFSPCPPPGRAGRRSTRRRLPEPAGLHRRRRLHQHRPPRDPGRAVERRQQQRPARGQAGGAGQPALRVRPRSAPQPTPRRRANPDVTLAPAASGNLRHPHQNRVVTPASMVPSRVTPTDRSPPGSSLQPPLRAATVDRRRDGAPLTSQLFSSPQPHNARQAPAEQNDLYPAPAATSTSRQPQIFGARRYRGRYFCSRSP